MVIIKKGEHGAFFYSKEDMFSLPAYPVEKVVDPTGAGDTFAGGVMGFITKSKKVNPKTMRKAVAYGTIISGFNVQGFGMKETSKLRLEHVNKKLVKFKKFFDF